MDADQDWALLSEIVLSDVLLLCCSPAERRRIRGLADEGLVEIRGRFFKKATITERGLRIFD